MKTIKLEKHLILIGIIFVLLIIRANISFCWSDESYYLSNLHRLYLGDSFIRDEWNSGMLSVYILLPVYTLYIKAMGSTKGVYLFFRLILLVLQLIVSIDVYKYFEKKGQNSVGLGSALFILIYSRANIGGVSYYNMCLLFFVWFVIQFMRKRYIGAGVLYGLAVIENPYLLIFGSYFVILMIGKKITWKQAAKFCLGGLISAGYFMFIFFSRITWHDLRSFFPVWNSYLQSAGGLTRTFGGFLRAFVDYFGAIDILIWIALLIMTIAYSFYEYYKGRNYLLWFICDILTFVWCLYGIYFTRHILGGSYIVIGLWAILQLSNLIIKRRNKYAKEILEFLIMAFILSLAFYLASNNGIDAIGIGFVAGSPAYFMIMRECIKEYEMSDLGKWIVAGRGMWGSLFILAWCVCFFLRIFAVYRDGTIDQCTVRMEQGPAAGLYTTPLHAEQYNNVCTVVDQYINSDMEREKKSLMVSKLAPWRSIYMRILYVMLQ